MLILKQLAYPICYLLGLNFVKYDLQSDRGVVSGEKSLTSAFFVVSMGAFSHYILNMFANIGSLSRNTIDIWSGKTLLATGQAALAVLAAAFFWAIMFSSKILTYKILAGAGCILVFAYNLILSGRMLLLLNALLLLECLVFTMTNGSLKKNSRMFLLMIVLTIVLYLALRYNLLGITELIGDSNLVTRFKDFSFYEDARMSTKSEYLKLLYKYPLGGGRIDKEVGMYAHDIFLDTYSDVGIIGACIVLIILFVVIYQAICVLKNKHFSADFRLLLLCVLSANMFIFLLEPILAGMQWLFCSFCFFAGVLWHVYNTRFVSGGETI